MIRFLQLYIKSLAFFPLNGCRIESSEKHSVISALMKRYGYQKAILKPVAPYGYYFDLWLLMRNPPFKIEGGNGLRASLKNKNTLSANKNIGCRKSCSRQPHSVGQGKKQLSAPRGIFPCNVLPRIVKARARSQSSLY